MNDILYLLMNITDYGIRGFLFVYLIESMVTPRFLKQNKRITSLIMILQFAVIQVFISNSPWVKRFLYGESMTPISSKPSVLCIAVSLCITLLFCQILYKGDKLGITYLVITYYAIMELVRFSLYSVTFWILHLLMDLHILWNYKEVLKRGKTFVHAINMTELVWNISTTIVILGVIYLFLKRYKKYVLQIRNYLKTIEIVFLTIPSMLGLLLSILLRCILFRQHGKEVHMLITDNPEMNFIIPMISVLCMIVILLSAKVFNRLVRDSEEKLKLEIYQDRIHGMEAHMKDVERLYDGIRGMKHDMKNYIADMEALVGENSSNTAKNVEELKEYLNGLSNAMEQLDMKYQTGNPVTDVVINRYVRQAEEKQIQFDSDFIFPSHMSIGAFDLSIILNNGLENALEACEKQKDNVYIKIYAYSRGNMFFVEIINSFQGNLKYNQDKQILKTTKQDGKEHGLGLKNIISCADKYLGRVEYKIEDNEFRLIVMLQGNKL